MIMLITITNSDNSTNTYGFAPEHKEQAIGFYTQLYWQGKIRKFIASLDDGSIVAIGA
jgi:hypothetical protein